MIQDKIYSYFDGNPQLHVLFIFDSMGYIAAELEGLDWRLNYHLEIFLGDWFTVKYRLAHDWKDEKIILVFKDVPDPSTGDADSSFPLYGEMKANMVYNEEDYVAFMQLKGIKSNFTPFIARHVAEMQMT